MVNRKKYFSDACCYPEIKLKPCPFCGGEAYVHRRLNKDRRFVICKDTSCVGHNLYIQFDTEIEAIMAWNRRAYEPD